MNKDTKLEEDDDFINALPESSDDEEIKLPAAGPSQDFLSDSDDEPPRGDIRPTQFGKENPPLSSQASNTRKSTRRINKSSEKSSIPATSSRLEGPCSSNGSKRSREEGAPESSSHLVDNYGFSKHNKKPKIRAPGKHSAKLQGYGKSSQKSSQKSPPGSSAPQRDDSSPNGTPRKPKFRLHSITSDDSPQKAGIKLFDSDGPGRGFEATSPGQQTARPGRSTRSQARTETNVFKSSPGDSPEAFSQKPVFKLPDDIDDLDSQIDDDGKVIVGSEPGLDNVNEDDTNLLATPKPKEARCPMCHEPVDPELLEKHSDRGRMNIRKQTAFCRLHKRRAALDSGTERGYPKIDWSTIESRLASHERFLREILEGSRPSHYASILKEKVESGKDRTLLKTGDSVTPGYYGPKGLRVMTEYIMRKFSSVLRKRAVEDRLISARSYTAYVQAVLVPELAARLVMEDMDVGEGGARDILRDSIEVGELLHEEAGDVIANMSEDENI
ncbi:hypothetical protein DL764_003802 [Monosporascus ibericus]|uniref:Restriction of telomere capping protein 4 n=1 Tax=Monosporascus ibericus TaxID=155417 RepID=A0A4Q4TJK8_9PEZI|nr:hypothetical protein DL764_003802 [Monosporascus ibericus]